MLKLRNASGNDLFVPDLNKTIQSGHVAEVDGELVDERDDAYEIRRGDGQSRAWPKAHWDNVTTLKRKPKTDEDEE